MSGIFILGACSLSPVMGPELETNWQNRCEGWMSMNRSVWKTKGCGERAVHVGKSASNTLQIARHLGSRSESRELSHYPCKWEGG